MNKLNTFPLVNLSSIKQIKESKEHKIDREHKQEHEFLNKNSLSNLQIKNYIYFYLKNSFNLFKFPRRLIYMQPTLTKIALF